MLAPEGSKRRVEQREISLPMHQERAKTVVELRPVSDVDVVERVRDVNHPTGMHVEARVVQQAAEVNQVAEERAHGRFMGAGRSER